MFGPEGRKAGARTFEPRQIFTARMSRRAVAPTVREGVVHVSGRMTNREEGLSAALPLDVRRASGLPARLFDSVGAAPQIRGVAPRELVSLFRKGGAFPHIRRHSRKRHDRRYRTASGSDRPRLNLSRSILSLLLRPL